MSTFSKFLNSTVIILCLGFLNQVSRADFCSKLNDYAKNKELTKDHEAEIAEFATPLYAEKDCNEIKKYKNEGWVLIDARNKASRKATGSFDGAVYIESNHHDASADKFNEKFLLKRLGKHFGNKSITMDDLKSKEIVLFCNGYKCYRSSWAACKLRDLGFNKDKVRVVLDGQAGLAQHCLK